MSRSLLDPGQIIKSSFDETNGAFKIIGIGGSLVPDTFNEIDLTYVPSGNGTGEIQTVVYKLNSNTVATLTLAYNSDNKLTTVTKS